MMSCSDRLGHLKQELENPLFFLVDNEFYFQFIAFNNKLHLPNLLALEETFCGCGSILSHLVHPFSFVMVGYLSLW